MPNIALNQRALNKLERLATPNRGIMPLIRQDGVTRVPGLSLINLDIKFLDRLCRGKKHSETFSEAILRGLP